MRWNRRLPSPAQAPLRGRWPHRVPLATPGDSASRRARPVHRRRQQVDEHGCQRRAELDTRAAPTMADPRSSPTGVRRRKSRHKEPRRRRQTSPVRGHVQLRSAHPPGIPKRSWNRSATSCVTGFGNSTVRCCLFRFVGVLWTGNSYSTAERGAFGTPG